jgi:hypothetical protein
LVEGHADFALIYLAHTGNQVTPFLFPFWGAIQFKNDDQVVGSGFFGQAGGI